jgi:hypothetical protein
LRRARTQAAQIEEHTWLFTLHDRRKVCSELPLKRCFVWFFCCAVVEVEDAVFT